MNTAELMFIWVKEEFKDLHPTYSLVKSSAINRKVFSKSDLDDEQTAIIMIMVKGSTITLYINNLDVVALVSVLGRKKIVGKIDEVHLVNPKSLIDLKKTISSTVDLLRRNKVGQV